MQQDQEMKTKTTSKNKEIKQNPYLKKSMLTNKNRLVLLIKGLRKRVIYIGLLACTLWVHEDCSVTEVLFFHTKYLFNLGVT